MNDVQYPKWLTELNEEDLAFIRKFILASGSLKEMAESYKVTYPTMRLRLDRLIQRITIAESEKDSGYVAYVKSLALNEMISVEAAKLLIVAYKKESK